MSPRTKLSSPYPPPLCHLGFSPNFCHMVKMDVFYALKYLFDALFELGNFVKNVDHPLIINFPQVKVGNTLTFFLTPPPEGKIFNWLNNGGGRGKQKHVYLGMPFRGKKTEIVWPFYQSWGPPLYVSFKSLANI